MKNAAPSSNLPTARLLQLGLTAAELAGSYMVGLGKLPLIDRQRRAQYLADLHQRSAMRLLERSGRMRGPCMKLIQLLSVQHGLMPVEYLEVLSQLQNDAPPFDADAVLLQLRRELGAPRDHNGNDALVAHQGFRRIESRPGRARQSDHHAVHRWRYIAKDSSIIRSGK